MARACYTESYPLKFPGAADSSAAPQIPWPPVKVEGTQRSHPWAGTGSMVAVLVLELFQARRGTENCGNVPCAGQGGLGPGGRELLYEPQLMGSWGRRGEGDPQASSCGVRGHCEGLCGVSRESWLGSGRLGSGVGKERGSHGERGMGC